MMMIAINHTIGNLRTSITPATVGADRSFWTSAVGAMSSFMPVQTRMARTKADRLSNRITSERAESLPPRTANMIRKIVDVAMLKPFLPPSSIPNARPCSSLDAQLRVALISADQNTQAVAIPQMPYRRTQISKDGIVEKTNPPADVITRATEISLRGEKRSANHPPGK